MGHVTAGYLAAKEDISVNILTRRPRAWQNEIKIHTPEGATITAPLTKITDSAAEAIPEADIILLCLPGYAIKSELQSIQPHIKPGVFVGSVFCSTGFFFEAIEIFGADTPLWGFQRVPFIARTKEYGRSANLLGYKPSHNIAIENCSDKEAFRQQIEHLFDRPTRLLANHYEATFTNSNPILHTSRLYTMFGGENEGRVYPRMIKFYEEWTVEAADMLIRMDEEFFRVLATLPVSEGYLPTILDYYESLDAASLARKLSSIEGFKGITSPMKQTAEGWVPDFESRYFTEDFPYGLKYIWQLAKEQGIDTPNIDKVYNWGLEKIK